MIHLINMPFASILYPSLPLGQMKAQLTESKIKSTVFNFNMHFARMIGFAKYEYLPSLFKTDTHIGEWLFSREAWGRKNDYPLEKLIKSTNQLDDQRKKEYEIRTGKVFSDVDNPFDWMYSIKEKLVNKFLEQCYANLMENNEINVIAFSCTFYQTIASLAMARLIKNKSPNTIIVFGGSCFHDEMGIEFIKKVKFIDYVSIGESDDIVVALFKDLLNKKRARLLQGVYYRKNESVKGLEPSPVSETILNQNPTPDYSDYFSDFSRNGINTAQLHNFRIFLPFESSRGCWWGEKQHCAFCGLNNEGMASRNKSPEVVINCLQDFINTYPVNRFHASDNILPMHYYTKLLPHLSKISENIHLFYEIKANVKRKHVKALSEAGVQIVQPGIESLSTKILQLIKKGTTALKNIYFLKLCRTYDVYPIWNILCRVPGEKKKDYNSMKDIIPSITHFLPPTAGPIPIELHRFSPFFFMKEKFNRNVRPKSWYQFLYPSDILSLEKIAYYFEADWYDVLSETGYSDLRFEIMEWRNNWRAGGTIPLLGLSIKKNGCIQIIDKRGKNVRKFLLNKIESYIYTSMDDIISSKTMIKKFCTKQFIENDLFELLNKWEKNKLLVHENNCYLGLALSENISLPDAKICHSLFGSVVQKMD